MEKKDIVDLIKTHASDFYDKALDDGVQLVIDILEFVKEKQPELSSTTDQYIAIIREGVKKATGR